MHSYCCSKALCWSFKCCSAHSIVALRLQRCFMTHGVPLGAAPQFCTLKMFPKSLCTVSCTFLCLACPFSSFDSMRLPTCFTCLS